MMKDAGNVGRIGPGSLQGAAVQSAACGLHHLDRAVLPDLNGLGHGLPVLFHSVSRAVVKYVPLAVDAHHPAVAVAHGIGGVHELSAVQTDIAGGVDRPLVDKALVGEQAHGVIEAGDVGGRIDQIVPLTDVTDGGALPIVRLLGVKIRRHDDRRLADDGQHIRRELHHKQAFDLVAKVPV